ncbi:hypothetical protein Hanom_Chr10g00945281 [Helianthus anomalus]
MIACWCIWKGRNDVVFKQKRCSPQEIVGELKCRGYAWVKSRSSCNYISWSKWCKYPMYMLLESLLKKEAPVNFLTNPLEGKSTMRPADVLVFSWAERKKKHACVDLTGISPLLG